MAAASLECAAAPFAIFIGDSRVVIDAAPGFSDTTFTGSPRLAELAETTTSASNKLLLFALTDADLRRFMAGDQPEFRRYLTAVTPRGMEHERVGAESFRLYVGDSLRDLGEAAPQGDIAKHLDSQPHGKASLLAELRKDPETVTVLQGTRLPSLERGTTWGGVLGTEKPRYAISTTTLMLMRGKAINLSVFSLYESAEDVQWIRTLTTRWIDEIRRLNGTR